MKHFLMACGLVSAALAVGCTGAAEKAVALRRSNLTQLGVGYQAYLADRGRGPEGVEQYCQFALEKWPGDEAVENACKSVRDGDIVVFWNGVLDEGADPEAFVLAFEASCPGSGGYLVTVGGTVTLVDAKRFSEMESIPQVEPDSDDPQAADG